MYKSPYENASESSTQTFLILGCMFLHKYSEFVNVLIVIVKSTAYASTLAGVNLQSTVNGDWR